MLIYIKEKLSAYFNKQYLHFNVFVGIACGALYVLSFAKKGCMVFTEETFIINHYLAYIKNKDFPCVAARASLDRNEICIIVADNIACPKDDITVLKFIYDFVDKYRHSNNTFNSLAIIFKGPKICTEEMFDYFMWQRLQALSTLDAMHYKYDKRVNADPNAANFSFSLKEEAFFVIGLHQSSSRLARQFNYPTLVFNPHAQFELMKETAQYVKMQKIVRKRDFSYSGSVNPMLQDFGNASEVYQYSGRKYDQEWECPLKIHHAKNNTTT